MRFYVRIKAHPISNGMKRNKVEQELSERKVPLAVFLESYNKSMPVGFAQATEETLKEFQSTHPMLFKHGNMWSIDQHRKRVLDWLFGRRDTA